MRSLTREMDALARVFNRFFGVEHMVRGDRLRGPLPSTKEAYGSLVRIAVPSVIEMVFMALIGSVDTVMVSALGYAAIAAVGLTGQPRMLMLSLFFALNVGVTAIVARRKGQNLPEEANRTLRNALFMVMGLTMVIMALALPLARPLMQLAGAQHDTIDMAAEYFGILAWFLPVNALTMAINAAQRGVGNTRITMISNVAANVVNVCGNALLIPIWGVAGAAYATGIGFCVGLVLSAAAVLSGKYGDTFLHLSLRDNWRPHWETIKSVLRVGGNAMVEQVAVRVGFFAYAAIIASLGTEAFAAHQVSMQFMNFSFTFGDGLAVAATSLVGQMLGRERPDMAQMYGKCAQRIALMISLVLASIVIVFRYPLVSIFLNPSIPANAEPYALAASVLIVVAMFQPVQMSSVVISGCLRGAGDNLYVALVMILCVVGIRPLSSLMSIHVLHFGLIGAWVGSLADMILRFVLFYTRFTGGKWQAKKV